MSCRDLTWDDEYGATFDVWDGSVRKYLTSCYIVIIAQTMAEEEQSSRAARRPDPCDRRSLANIHPLGCRERDDQRRICTELQMQLWQDVPYIPMGEYWQSTAYRRDLLDVLPGCFAVFWGIRRA